LEQIDKQQQHERHDEHGHGQRGCASVSNCASLVTIKKGVISVRMGMFPEIKTTEPYSPTARAKASAKPVNSAGISSGKMTRRQDCQRVAPKVAAASSISGSRS